MNQNLLLAILEAKDLITEDQANALAEYLSSGVQSMYYKDAQAAVKKILDKK